MDEKEAEARPLMGTIFLVLQKWCLYTASRTTNHSMRHWLYNPIPRCKKEKLLWILARVKNLMHKISAVTARLYLQPSIIPATEPSAITPDSMHRSFNPASWNRFPIIKRRLHILWNAPILIMIFLLIIMLPCYLSCFGIQCLDNTQLISRNAWCSETASKFHWQ